MTSPHPIVRQIVDRDCHVSMSNRDVVRHVISKLRQGYETFRALSRPERRRLIADTLQVHQENWELYAAVMRGTTSPGTKRGEEPLPATLSGKQIVALMRKHRRTIAELAFRMGISQARVRRAREEGLSNALVVRDWLQAISGDDPGPIPEKYRIRRSSEEAPCNFCGCPLDVGDEAFAYVNEVFCSVTCCRHSRGWH